MPRRSVIIDCDPGEDDAVMLFLAFGSREDLDIRAITTVAGNVPLAKTQRNARIVCELAGVRDIPVFAGCDRPILCDLVTAEHVHGREGMEGAPVYDPDLPLQPRHAVDYLVDALTAAEDESTTLVVTGPCTNVAVAMRREPRILPKIREIVVMGGALREGGNTTPAAEFNIFVDPHAADIVFRCGRPIVVLPLDVTHRVLTTRARTEAFARLGNATGPTVRTMMECYNRSDVEKYGSDGGPLHDPCTIAWLLRPELFRGKSVNVAIEMHSPLTLGATVADFWYVTDRAPNATWVYDVDADGFFRLLNERLARLP